MTFSFTRISKQSAILSGLIFHNFIGISLTISELLNGLHKSFVLSSANKGRNHRGVASRLKFVLLLETLLFQGFPKGVRKFNRKSSQRETQHAHIVGLRLRQGLVQGFQSLLHVIVGIPIKVFLEKYFRPKDALRAPLER